MSMARRHKTDTSDLEALLLELETMPRLDFMNGVKRVVNNVVQGRIVSRADIVSTCEKIINANERLQSTWQMSEKAMTLFNDFLQEAKTNDTPASDKSHYVTGLAAKWMSLKPMLTLYETEKRGIPETAVVRGMIDQLKKQIIVYAKSWPKEFKLAGGP